MVRDNRRKSPLRQLVVAGLQHWREECCEKAKWSEMTGLALALLGGWKHVEMKVFRRNARSRGWYEWSHSNPR